MGRLSQCGIDRFRLITDCRDRPLLADSVEKVDLLPGLRQNQVIGRREDSQHGGTIVEPTRTNVYSFNIEDYIPANHLLRNIDRCLDLSDLRHYLADFYSPIGRP